MRLILTLSGAGISGADAMRTLSAGKLSIGRAANNDWVVPDPRQNLSRTHCTITAEGRNFVLTDSSSNGMYINGAAQATERDSRYVLQDGDVVRLGDYQLSVGVVDDSPALGARPAAGGLGPDNIGRQIGGARAMGGPLDIDPLDDPLGGPRGGGFGQAVPPGFAHPMPPAAAPVQPSARRGADPFDRVPPTASPQGSAAFNDDDLFSGIKPSMDWTGPSRPDNVPPTAMAMPKQRIVPAANPMDIDFDALIGDLNPLGGAQPAMQPPPAAPMQQVPPQMMAQPAPQMPQPMPMAPPPQQAQAAPPLQIIPTDLDPFAEPVPQRPAQTAPRMPEPVVSQAPAFATAPQPAPLPAATTPPAAAHPQQAAPAQAAAAQAGAAPAAVHASSVEADARALFAAFLEGAGVADRRIEPADPAAALRAAGAIFRVMAEGVRDVLLSRAAIKSEMRIEQTMISSQGNNALKFSVTGSDAVAAMLTPKRPGYMESLAAAREAFDDIKSHELAVMAGVQTALMALLRRFDPDELEKRLSLGGLASVLPAARKARYWEAFRMTFGDISREAEDDFQSVFGRSFAKAYMEQTRKE